MRFDEPVEEEELQEISKSETDVHVRVNQYPYDDTDYPQNPFSDRETPQDSLFFNDKQRSVDYVLVWKKVLVPDNCDETDALKLKEIDDISKKEMIKAEKREVFQENLMNEGLELETYIVDDEIHFIKIHAPLEVLRRYAEILKLRLPMKEVNIIKKTKVIITFKICSHTKELICRLHIHTLYLNCITR